MNPTGTTNLTENPAYVYTDGDVYQILQTDTVEGAATAASFSGLGVDNQPHQVLLNKTKVLRVNQLADEVNISALLAFKALFSGALGANEASSIFKIPFLDSAHGVIQLILQTGQYIGNVTGADQAAFVNWPTSFPNAFGNALAIPVHAPATRATTATIGMSSMSLSPGRSPVRRSCLIVSAAAPERCTHSTGGLMAIDVHLFARLRREGAVWVFTGRSPHPEGETVWKGETFSKVSQSKMGRVRWCG